VSCKTVVETLRGFATSGELLSTLLDGDLPPRDEVRVRLHVDACAECRGELAGLETLREALRAEAANPPLPDESRGAQGDGWAALAARIGPTGPAPSRPRWRGLWVWAPAVALLVALGAGLTVRALRSRGTVSDDQLIAEAENEFRDAEQRYRRAVDKLRVVAAHAGTRMSSTDRRAFEEAHAAIETATERCRETVRMRPADPDAEEQLFAAYRKQIGFLQDSLLRAQGSR
jgi:anti-sigma factor RsiW